jgi:hypothetical protein
LDIFFFFTEARMSPRNTMAHYLFRARMHWSRFIEHLLSLNWLSLTSTVRSLSFFHRNHRNETPVDSSGIVFKRRTINTRKGTQEKMRTFADNEKKSNALPL